MATWQHMVQVASKAPTSGSAASNAAKCSLFAGIITSVLKTLVLAPPVINDKAGGNNCQGSLWLQVHELIPLLVTLQHTVTASSLIVRLQHSV